MAFCVSHSFSLFLSIFISDRHIELTAFLVELIRNFEFELEGKYEQVFRVPCNVMAPTVRGDVGKGMQLGFKVKAVTRDE